MALTPRQVECVKDILHEYDERDEFVKGKWSAVAYLRDATDLPMSDCLAEIKAISLEMFA